jgi:predicted membrane metal-binding protein
MGKEKIIFVISGFLRDVDKNCALLGYYVSLSGNSVPTFRDGNCALLGYYVSLSGNSVPTFRDGNCALMGYYVSLTGSSVPTFRGNISVPS